MKLLVAGYSQDETHRVSAELRSAGHQVLGALGRSGARTFVKVVTPDLVVVPAAEADAVRGWLADLPVGELEWLVVAPGDDPAAAVASALALALAPTTVDVETSASSPDAGVTFEPPASPRGARVRSGTEVLSRPPTRTPRAPESRGFSRLSEAAIDVSEGEGLDDIPASPTAPPPLPPLPRGSDAQPPTAPRSEPSPHDGAAPPSDLVSKLAQTRFGDYHSILEVEPGASPYAVREQFTRLSRLYSPRGWPRRLGPEELEILQEVASGIRDAYLILGDPELRARYERALLGA